MSQIALDEERMGALARALVAGAAELERVAAVIRRVGLDTGHASPAGPALDRVAAARRQSAVDVRRRARAAQVEEHRTGPPARSLPVCGPEWRTMTRAQIAAANGRYRLEVLRRAGGSSWGVAGVVGGWVRREVQRAAKGVRKDTAAFKAASDWETEHTAAGLAWMDEWGTHAAAAMPGPLRPLATIFGSGLSGVARGTAGGLTGVQAIVATNADGMGRLGVAASHADADEAADAGRDVVDADAEYVRGAALALAQTARVSRMIDPGNPGSFIQLSDDVREKGLTNALADDARDVGAEVPGAGLLLLGDPPSPVAKTTVTVSEAGAFEHGDHGLEHNKPEPKPKPKEGSKAPK